MTMTQQAPYPAALADLVGRLRYKPGWAFTLTDRDRGQGSVGLTLEILIQPPDAYHPDRVRPVAHYMIVPAAAFGRDSWQRWLLDQILAVEQHEACEFFAVAVDGREDENGWHRVEDVVHPYAPNHGPGRDPYVIHDYATDEDRRTSFRGTLNRPDA